MPTNIEITTTPFDTTVDPTNDYLLFVDVSEDAINRITPENLFNEFTSTFTSVQTAYVPASAMIAATTQGAASAQLEAGGNGQNYIVLDFDGSAVEYAHFNIAMPASWNEGTVTFQALWTTTSAGTNGVAWRLQARAVSDGDTIDGTWGTAVTVVDNGQSSSTKLYISAESAAVTVGNTPIQDDLIYFRVSRNPADAGDTMTEDARLIGIRVFYTTNTLTDA